MFQILFATWSVLIRFKGEEINPVKTLGLSASFGANAWASPPIGDDPAPLAAIYAPDPAKAPSPADPPKGAQDTRTAADNRILLAQNQISSALPSSGAIANHIAHRISLPEVEEMVKRALQLREQGDCQGALELLRQADAKLPSHPKILAELATTLQQMGLDTKAAEYWERVHQMGAAGAGAYWDLSDMALKGQILDEASNLDTYLRISRHSAQTVPATDGSQHIVLRIHIESALKEPISGDDMYLNVLFYDSVNSSTFEPTVADTKPIYVTQPYDWKDASEEIIEVEYFLPKLTAEQTATLGQRQFFGYVVELYYKDLLQDIVASPRKLARLGSSASRAARPIRQSLPQP